MKKKNTLFIIIVIIFLSIIGILLINQLNNQTGELIKTNYKQITKKIDNKEDFILIISRSNCSHCISYKPKVEQIAKKYKIVVYYIDYDEEEKKDELLKELKLDGSTPITLFFKNGKETSILNRLEGDVDNDKIIDKFKKMEFVK